MRAVGRVCLRNKKKGQQEIVGFVLIVVLVMVALMIFLIISARDSGEEESSVEVSSMLSVIMRSTSGCAPTYIPNYDNFEELFKDCYKGGNVCSESNVPVCEYLNESLKDVVSSMFRADSSVESWEIEFFVKDGEGILRWSEGVCSGTRSGAQKPIFLDGENLIVRMRICSAISKD